MGPLDLYGTAGAISTTMFLLGNVPMLLRAARIRSLGSYSLAYLAMNNFANLVHWVYVLSLPAGPLWVLHGLSSVSALLMLIWYLRFEWAPRHR